MLTGGSMVSYHILNVFHRFNASTDATNALSTSPTPLRHPLRIPADTNLVEPSMFWYVLAVLVCFGSLSRVFDHVPLTRNVDLTDHGQNYH